METKSESVFFAGVCIFAILVSIVLWIFRIRHDRSDVFDVIQFSIHVTAATSDWRLRQNNHRRFAIHQTIFVSICTYSTDSFIPQSIKSAH